MTAASTSGASTTKRFRSTKAEMRAFRQALFDLVRAGAPMTIRHAFYRAVATDLVDKSERQYRRVQRELVKMRRDWWFLQKLRSATATDNDRDAFGCRDMVTDGLERLQTSIPFAWVADNTRWTRKPESYASPDEALEYWVKSYRRDMWRDAPVYVEVWCESDSIAGVISDITYEYDVPLQVVRGMSSISYLYGAAQVIANTGKPAFLYYFGDYDKTGMDIDRNAEKDIREFAGDAEIHFERMAITAEQIEEYDLPTKPSTKHKSFPNTVELEAFPPDQLRALVRACIEQHLDDDRMSVNAVVEESEREGLLAIASTYRPSATSGGRP